ncbi:hypothetical protein EDB83DRAFT_1300339 [Lactarius deliciosus]|nr:hypothetical protein EDB83DRAFT_1300339 [Lactarius deliciosus]
MRSIDNPRAISVVRQVSRTRASYPPASYPSETSTSTIPYPMATTNGSSTWWSRSGDKVLSNSTNTPQSNDRVTDRKSHRAANGTGLEGGSPYSSSIWRGTAPQLSSVSIPRARAPRLVRTNYRGRGGPSLPKQQPQRVGNPRLMLMRNRMHGIEQTRTCPTKIQADHMILPPPPYRPPSRPVYLHRKVIISLGVVAPSLVSWSHHGPCH